MATVTGYVERIKYRNEDNGYSVLSVADGGEEYILVGTFPYISEGERIEATGRMVEHSIYGEQLAVESYEIKAPEDTLAIERYLGSGAIKGIGAALAKRIVKKFKADTFRIMEEEPDYANENLRISKVTEMLKDYICENYMKDLSVQQMAEKTNYSEPHFCRLFKQSFGQNFTSYLTEYRINMAKKMLEQPTVNVKDVGKNVGYEDSNYFTKVFRRITGQSPTEYRNTVFREKG